MTRNINNRVEVLCPIKERRNKEIILHTLEVMLRDNTKARFMQQDGTYRRCDTGDGVLVNSQETFNEEALENQRVPEIARKGSRGLSDVLRKIFSRILS